jgi:hypothetical protein
MTRVWLVLAGGVLLAQDPFQVAPDHYKLVFENPYVRVVRVIYGPHEKSPVHDHPANPTVYVYTTDGGQLRIQHTDGHGAMRPAVVAGGVRFNRGMAERHTMENLTGVGSEYIRVELKTVPIDHPEKDVRLAPGSGPFENGQIRISRAVCAAHSACPSPERPTVDVPIGSAAPRWIDASRNSDNQTDSAQNIVRIELKTAPAR